MKKIILLLGFAGLLFLGNATQTESPETDSVVQSAVSGDISNNSLTADQLFELEKMKITQSEYYNSQASDIIPVLIPIVMFIVVFFIIFILFYFRKKEREAKYRVIEKAIELGQPLPEGIFDEKKTKKEDSALKTGIILLFSGIGIVLSFFLLEEKEGALIGLIPSFLGLGFLLIGWLEKRNKKSVPLQNKNEE